ncbi:BamA/TamA family outer membrane protein [Runella slithyformis]|uniref:Surface antigen (D15) n=1 Tax=Runella slithyformis (strain ATCC 29530 / DSM 19594 / LMG 11500 / NCIMB 11436 / LSU 4) TaxID=761193 RepID=A0A7U3ZH93_RUNSL|nr:BamA/TamA family outer membrane protein [Runella slithyformis]AEI47206.1 surface antigen (D15) [Runella slithyformis DSM 19594]
MVPQKFLPRMSGAFLRTILLCGLLVQTAFAQQKRLSILPFPAVYYSPETRWAYGAALTATFRFKNDSVHARPSQMSVGIVFTQEKQSLYYLPFRLFLKNAGYYLNGELGFYKYNYYYFGIGNQPVPKELFGVDFPRIRLNFFKKIYPHLYVGVRYQYEDYRITQTTPNGEFANGRVPGTPRSLTSGVGAGIFYDTRDVVFFPSKGIVADIAFFNNAPFWGANVLFNRLSADVSGYVSPRQKMVLAGNIFSSFTWGNAPFNMLSELGGGKLMRGYYQGRLRDDNALLAQGEVRFDLFKRLGGVVFGSTAVLGNQKDILRWRAPAFACGTGIRFTANRRDHLNIRFDYAIGHDGGNFYFTVGEAF